MFCFHSYRNHFVQTAGFTFLSSCLKIPNAIAGKISFMLWSCTSNLSWHHLTSCTKPYLFAFCIFELYGAIQMLLLLLLLKTCSLVFTASRHTFILSCRSMFVAVCVTEYVFLLVYFVCSSAGLVSNVADQMLSVCVSLCLSVCVFTFIWLRGQICVRTWCCEVVGGCRVRFHTYSQLGLRK